jgi:3-hydroxyacyl-[acyl-carrier-protein] dehydratase
MAKKTGAITLPLTMGQIQAILPQRFPFLFIDRVVAFSKKKATITCIKNVSVNEPYFQGHFPQNPIMPGALIVETMAQAGIILYAFMKPERAAKHPDYLLGKIEASFKSPVMPGDQLIVEVKIEKLIDSAGIVKAYTKSINKLVAEATISFGVRFNHD